VVSRPSGPYLTLSGPFSLDWIEVLLWDLLVIDRALLERVLTLPLESDPGAAPPSLEREVPKDWDPMGKLLSPNRKKDSFFLAFSYTRVGHICYLSGPNSLCFSLEGCMVGCLLSNVPNCETRIRLSDPPLMVM
jgi:hypothetical protein